MRRSLNSVIKEDSKLTIGSINACTDAHQSSLQPQTASTPPGSGPAATALGIGLPSRALRYVEVNI